MRFYSRNASLTISFLPNILMWLTVPLNAVWKRKVSFVSGRKRRKKKNTFPFLIQSFTPKDWNLIKGPGEHICAHETVSASAKKFISLVTSRSQLAYYLHKQTHTHRQACTNTHIPSQKDRKDNYFKVIMQVRGFHVLPLYGSCHLI